MFDGKPYKGLKVVDVSQGFAAPYCAGLLALYGADVVKIEPLEGDWARGIGRNKAGQTPLHIVGNRGKRSISLNLKHPKALDVVNALAKNCDVFLESFRPGVATRLGISYKDIWALNSDVLYVSVSGFGQEGLYSGRPATDTVIQAFSGLMSVNLGMDGVPHRVGMLAVDTSAALHTFQALQAALFSRRKGCGGHWLKTDLMSTTAAFLSQKIAEFQMEEGQYRQVHPPAGAYQTSDGWIVFTLVKEEHFKRICRALEKEEWIENPRYQNFKSRLENKMELIDQVAKLMKAQTTATWVERFNAEDVLSNSVYTIGEWLTDPHVRESQIIGSINQPDSGMVGIPIIPGTIFDSDLYAPANGEHGREILEELGVSSEKIEELVSSGAVKMP